MPKSGWYVIQVQSGREQVMCDVIRRTCEEFDAMSIVEDPLVEEVFSPRYATRMKVHGEWKDVERQLLPGYVVATTSRPDDLGAVLCTIPELTRMLALGEAFVPLREEERMWIEESTKQGDRVVPMSLAVGKGDNFTVKEGPLKGREGLVTRVNRHKCFAIMELHVGQMTIRTKVGLAIVPEDSQEPNN